MFFFFFFWPLLPLTSLHLTQVPGLSFYRPLLGNLKMPWGFSAWNTLPPNYHIRLLLTIHTTPNLSPFKSTSFYLKQSPSTASPLLEQFYLLKSTDGFHMWFYLFIMDVLYVNFRRARTQSIWCPSPNSEPARLTGKL